MEPVTVTLIATTVVASVSAIVAVFRKNIRRSTCLGGTIEFRDPDGTATSDPKPKSFFNRSFRNRSPTDKAKEDIKPTVPTVNINIHNKDELRVSEC